MTLFSVRTLPLGLAVLLTGCALTLFLSACASDKGGPSDSTNAGASSDNPTARIDSLAQPIPPAPDPGTAHVRGTIDSCEQVSGDEPSMQCALTVDAVLEYGSSTPVLGPGTQTVRLSRSIASDWTESLLKQAGTAVYVLRHGGERMQTETMDGGKSDSGPKWTVVAVSRADTSSDE